MDNKIILSSKDIKNWKEKVVPQWSKIVSAATGIASGNVIAFMKNLLGSAKVVKTKESQTYFLLVTALLNSTLKAMEDTCESPQDWAKAGLELDIKRLFESYNETKDIEIDKKSFIYPQQLAFFKAYCEQLRKELKAPRFNDIDKARIIAKIPELFLRTADKLLRDDKDDSYKLVQRFFSRSILGEAVAVCEAWKRYREYLQEDIEEPIFGDDDIPLKDIYIPLRAYYTDKKKGEIAVDLQEYLYQWIDEPDYKDFLRVVIGEPGAGKSSFSKMFAARCSIQYPRIKVIRIPLYELEEEVEGYMGNRIEAYLNASYRERIGGKMLGEFLSYNLREPQERILLILDGLDELVAEEKGVMDVVSSFVSKVKTMAAKHNKRRKGYLQVLLTGRPFSINEEDKYLYLLPYKIDNTRAYRTEKINLKIDQRDEWWIQYAKLKTQNYDELFRKCKGGDLDELSRVPLLNYLIALAYDLDTLKIDDNPNRAEIYYALISGVYKREYQDEVIHPNLDELSEDDFFTTLGDIAYAAWQGGGRLITHSQIWATCKTSRIEYVKSILEQEGEKGVLRLLMAFYFRKKSDDLIEFTQINFQEYLTAFRIISHFEELVDNIGEDAAEETKKNVLAEWLHIVGSRTLNQNIFDFIHSETERRHERECNALTLQNAAAKLLSHTIVHNMPVERTAIKPFKEMVRQARNADETLLILHHAYCNVLRKNDEAFVPTIESNDKTSISDFVARLFSQREKWDTLLPLAVYCFAYWNFQGQSLMARDLFKVTLINANLEDANLEDANLREANLREANLINANLINANLFNANLREANLREANLEDANLEDANLEDANLINANLINANLEDTTLSGATLRDADLSGATLINATLKDGTLVNANLSGANLSGANLSGADLSGADLSGATLRETDLSGATLKDGTLINATLEEATLINATLEEATLEEATLEEANLSGANLSGADLNGANLINANLRGATLSGATLSGATLSGATLSRATLSKATLKDATLFNANLINANLFNATLSNATLFKANLFKANLFKANLFKANLFKANLEDATLIKAILEYATLSKANLFNAIFFKANLEHANLEYANLSNANLEYANLSNANLEYANLSNANLSNANLEGAKNLTYKQLTKVRTLYKTTGIPPEIESKLRETHPHLFEKPKWLF